MIDNSVPTSIGIILDGNRRWAKEKGLPTLEGHRAGYENVKKIARAAFGAGIKYLTVYAFSTENWNRTQEEVSYLMALLASAVKSGFDELSEEDIKIRFIGDFTKIAISMRDAMKDLEEKTKTHTKGTLIIAISYGGRSEITHAVNALITEGKKVVSEEDIAEALWSRGVPDPDLIIRTSGEQRLSNFLPWQAIYSELFFTKTYWPDFSKEELHTILEEYTARERRHGK